MPIQMPLLLLPGLMNDARVWEPLLEAVRPRFRPIVAETHVADSVAALAACALGLLPAGPFAVAGFSLGGYVALEVCRQAQDRIAGLALLDTGARADTDESKQGRQRMVAALGSGTASFAQIAEGFAPRLVHPAHAQDMHLVELLGDMARAVGPTGFVRQQTAAIHRPDSREILQALHCPSLVLCGQEDQVTPPALSEEMAGLLAGDVQLVIVPECGHMSTLEHPATVRHAFGQWLDRVDASRHRA